jgi:phosphomannomutase
MEMFSSFTNSKIFIFNNQLNNDVVVSTVMSNFGFKNAMEKNNFKNVETSVGDKYVAEAMGRKQCIYRW